MAILRIILFVFFYFLRLNIFQLKKVRKIKNEKERVSTVREFFREFGKGVMKRASSKVEVFYEDKKAFDKISFEEPLVVVSNHQSNFDIPAIIGYFPFIPGFMAKKELERCPFIKTWMELASSVFIDRKNPREGIRTIRKTVKFIKSGYPILIFPEGTRSDNGEIGHFKNGGFKVAIDAKAKIIPVTLKGTYEIQNKKSIKVNKNKNIKIIIGKAIDTKNYNREEVKNIHNVARDTIVKNFDKY